ncbi:MULTISPECIES: putative lipid II flippase FtsW [Vitreoscilla]|uniref:Probable peptidoglycan glycosyltransferase FtsW n=1 Tax=Vitreoscilla stercoraria TaxID=61 RepID=A0ABY4EBH4_VITST|nr:MULTISPECIES: putative lipid II flippase FtsW [Vitreoscilla]AUZ05866.2 lipid 2 flippase FtsW [Vitreoscilla sp. C1]UOO92759.1 putative lipid II flippase FtsW [Vitreoscilla stercoraria]
MNFRINTKWLDRTLLKNGETFDWSLLWMIVLMTMFSLVMIFSASIEHAERLHDDRFYFVERQLIFLSMGFFAMWCMMKTPIRTMHKGMWGLLLFSFLLLVLVLVLGREINGAKRWIHIGPFNIQPTEIFKIAIILYLSSFLTRRVDVLTNFRKVWFVGIPIGAGLALVMLEPDFGSFVVVAVIAVGLLFIGGLPMGWFLAVVGIAIASMVTLVWTSPYRVRRVTAFMNPWEDPFGSGYQLTHALMAFARGEWLGAGLGASVEKRFYLPEAHTDFIAAVIGEELGFAGLFVLIFCYVWLVWRAFSIGKQARDLEQYFAAYTAKGIGICLGIQSFFNLGVNLGLLPTKGLTLPLISYGGSAVIVMLLCMGILLRVDWENRRVMRGYKV